MAKKAACKGVHIMTGSGVVAFVSIDIPRFEYEADLITDNALEAVK